MSKQKEPQKRTIHGIYRAIAIMGLLSVAGSASAQTEVRRYEAGVTSVFEDNERGGVVTITVRALLQDGVPWVWIEAQSGTSATVTLSIPVSDVRDFLTADPASFLNKTVNVPTDEDRTEVFVPALAWAWGDYFGLVRKDWWDATTIAFMFREGEADPILAEGDATEATALLDLLTNAEARITTWETEPTRVTTAVADVPKNLLRWSGTVPWHR